MRASSLTNLGVGVDYNIASDYDKVLVVAGLAEEIEALAPYADQIGEIVANLPDVLTVQQAVDVLNNLSVSVTTLEPGAVATSELVGTEIRLGIPRGEQGLQGIVGPKGDKGNKGDVGLTGAQGPIGLTGPQGPRGLRGNDGVDGVGVEITSILNNPNKSLTINFSDGTQHTTDPLKGQDGTSITITNVINNANGTMLINFSDGTSHHTMDLRGQRGFKGDTGDHVHHISYQRSKDPLGNEVGPVKPGQPGYYDAYAMWLSQEELPEEYIGEFVVRNGLDGLPAEDQAKLDSIEFGATRDQLASEVPFNNTSTGFVASNVQTALVELKTGKEDKSDKGMPNGYAGLGVDGKVASTQMPTYVTSVAGKTGVVTLEKSDVGLENVQNVDTTNATNISSGTLNTSRLANSGVTAGTYRSVTTDSKGRITAGTNPTTVAGYGLTDVFTKTEVQTVLPKVGFDTSNVTAPTTGQLAWNGEEATLDLGINGATLQIGQEHLIRVRNNSGSSITNGRVVMATGTLGNSGRIVVGPANLTQANAKYVLGVVTESIAKGADGFCTTFGKVRGINTTGSDVGETWLDGDVLYVKDSGNGVLTRVVPTDSQVKLPVAIVIHAHSSGTLFVRVNSIDENHAKVELALKAAIASPTFTGVPRAPTASVGTNTTQLATTAFVIAEINKIEEW